jgi:hypothetical protein
MKLEDAVTEQDFIKVYTEKFGEPPVVSGGKGFPIIDDIIRAVVDNIPINEELPPAGALL